MDRRKTCTRGHMYKLFPHCNRVDLCTSISSHSASNSLPSNRMTSVVLPGLLVLSKALTYQSFYRLDTNPSCSSLFLIVYGIWYC